MVNYFSVHSSGNQRRTIRDMVSGADVATYESGNDTSKATAYATAEAAQAAAVAALITGGQLKANATYRYELPELQRAYAASL